MLQVETAVASGDWDPDIDWAALASRACAAALALTPHAALAGDCQADVAIIGGGATGLSAALHLAQRGASVVLLEAGRIGHGASGRNGGQIIPGLRLGAADLVARFGAEQGGALFHLALSARDLVVDLPIPY
jgi:gamma-glutamylputrescine oxidase